MSSSSNSNNGPPHEFEFVKTLVRDLHMTRNVARPDEDQRHMKKNASDAGIHLTAAEKLLFNRLDANSHQSSVSDMEDSYNEGDNISRSSGNRDIDLVHGKRLPHASDFLKKSVPSTHHQSNCSLNIPSVVITDANEHVDLFSSTQRRFSQLYSGLRRFSTSHTVWLVIGMRFCGFDFYVDNVASERGGADWPAGQRVRRVRHLLYRPHKWMSCSVNRLTHQHAVAFI